MIRRPAKGPLADSFYSLDFIEGDTFELKPKGYDKSSVML